jgi:hypothetical protein
VEEQLTLHEVVVLGQLVQFSLDVSVLLSHQLIESFLHFVQNQDQELAALEFESFNVVLEVVGSGKLILQLIAPFGQHPENLRILDLQVMREDFVFGEVASGFGQLPRDLVGSILLHLQSIFLLVFDLDLNELLLELILGNGVFVIDEL